MNLQELSPNNAMIAGSDCWIIPDAEHSPWVKKLDWYCNFQLKKTEFKELKFLSENIKKISEEEDYGIDEIRCEKDAPILIIGSGFVPCKYLVQLKFNGKENWTEQIYKIKSDLKINQFRVFLPKEMNREEFFRIARENFDKEDDISFVLSI
jgi:hypothetical protein